MITKTTDIEVLKDLLENLHNPEALDTHPWVSRAFVKDAVARNSALQKFRPGKQLIGALCELFAETVPGVPPRRGKRLDNHWGEFGILAAQFFVPIRFGNPAPASLRDAWGGIDKAILLFVFGNNGNRPTPEAIQMYKLVGNESDIAPISTLSDWHRKGLQRLLEAIETREQYLETLAQPAVAVSGSPSHQELPAALHPNSSIRKVFLFGSILIICSLFILGGIKAKRVYEQALVVKLAASSLRDVIAASPDIHGLQDAGPRLVTLRQDFDDLKAEVEPFLWMGPWLEWVPVYGGDLASSREILELADVFLQSGETSYLASGPLMAAWEGEENVNPAQLVTLLQQQEPGFEHANNLLGQAVQIRAGLDDTRLSPGVQGIVHDLDRSLPLMAEGLKVALALPDFLGASANGPRTYLLLVQNEDELRPTGGFITAVGTLVVKDGQVLNVSFVDSGELDNWDYPYPSAPWQLEQYMNSPVLVLRDSNWFADFPTSALYAETLFAYNSAHSVDGVIAFDQHMLVLILQALGPVQLAGIHDPVDAGNVISYMRAAKSPPMGEPVPDGWSRKAFMDQITKAILDRMFEGDGISWERLGTTLLQGLDQRHLLLQLDNASLASISAEHGWDGAIDAGRGDYLRVVDANIGFNKTSALVDLRIIYDVDLTDLTRPVGRLSVIHTNRSRSDVQCLQWGGQRATGEEDYPVNACYWNYMRIYKPAATQLLDATPQRVPANWMVLDHGVARGVDVLDEDLSGLQGFGTLMVVPGGGSVTNEFEFSLPGAILEAASDTDEIVYHLKVDKQPGTIAIPLTVRIHIPNGSFLDPLPAGAIVEGNHLLFETNLSVDVVLKVSFQVK